MKNFIFALCGFLMMTFVSLNVQASSISEPIPSKSDVSVNVGLPMIQNDVVTVIPMDFLVVAAPQAVFMSTENPAVRSKHVSRYSSLSVRSGTSISRSIVPIIVIPYIVN